MTVLILKFLTDLSWYLAIVFPLMVAAPVLLKVILTAVPAAWAVWLMITGRKRDMGGGAQDAILFEGKLLAVAAILELAMLGVSRWQSQCGVFVLAFFVFGILLLRVSRVSEAEQSKAKFLGLNGLYLFLLAVCAFLLSMRPVREAAVSFVSGMYRYLILPVLILMVRALVLVFEILGRFIPALEPLSQYEAELTLETGLEAETAQMTVSETPVFFKVFGILLAAVLGFLFLRYLYRKFSDVGRYDGRDNAGTSVREQLSPDGERQSGWGEFSSERNIRYYYRKFLKLCRKRGLYPEGIATSQAVEQAARSLWQEDGLSAFREQYLKVRYGGHKESSEEKKRDREQYRKLKAEEKEYR